jgi:hypothetical protein
VMVSIVNIPAMLIEVQWYMSNRTDVRKCRITYLNDRRWSLGKSWQPASESMKHVVRSNEPTG